MDQPGEPPSGGVRTTNDVEQISPVAPRPTAAVVPLTAEPSRRGVVGNLGLVALSAFAVLALVIAMLVLAKPVDRAAIGPTPEASAAAAVPWTSVEETFDSLPMNSKLPETWSVTGAGTAAVVALPTSVDRSVRITSSVSGEVTSACRSTAVVLGGPVRIAVDYAVGRPPSSPVPLISIDSGTARQVALGMDSSGAPIELPADGTVSPRTDDGSPPSPAAISRRGVVWQRLEVTIDAATGAANWQVRDTSGALTGSGTARLANPTSGLDTICLLSPKGSPSGWIAVDDLVVGG